MGLLWDANQLYIAIGLIIVPKNILNVHLGNVM